MKPVLSIGMIFKNEIRCLERCLKSLEPLRAAVPCELVMADTGSDDGSRAVAERYADILIDFPWIDDFAAARNAVIDRCSGEWYLSIDADEWLGEDVSQLVRFLTHQELWERPFCGVMVRNYFTPELDDDHSDFLAVRIARISTGMRFVGAIHELWDQGGDVYGLGQTILHHDGYVPALKEQKKTQERNMKPLREKLERNPDDLKTLLQCIESAQGDPSYEWYVRQAVAAVERKVPQWEHYGPPIFRYGVFWAAAQHLPELEKWAKEALEWFPDSIYITVDVVYALFADYAETDCAKAIPMGERYLRSVREYLNGQFNYKDLIFSSLIMATRSRECIAKTILANCYFSEKRFQEARETLLEIDCAWIRPEAVGNYIRVLMNLHAQGGADVSPAIADFWEKTDRPAPRSEQGAACRRAMSAAAAAAFSPAYQKAEEERGFRHAWTLYLPLAGKCEIGNAARVLAADTPEEMTAALAAVEDWAAFPAPTLARAIAEGAPFPLPEKPLQLEEMDALAARIAQEPELLRPVLRQAADHTGTRQGLAWARGLALAAVQTEKWDDAAQGMELARLFAEVERAFLPLCYAPEALQEDLFLLPPLHRLGFHCARAFAALDAGDAAGFTRCLRAGLAACEGAKAMVEFLLEHTPALQKEEPSAELLALAERVRTMLAAFSPDDPAVAALKASPVYQRVANLIEGDRI